MPTMFLRLFFCVLLTLTALPLPGGDWPQFRGSERNNISQETGMLRSWPAQGPKVLWKIPGWDQKLMFSLDPKCRFHALDVKTGKLIWQKNLVQEYKATIPSWYAGQNPLLDGNQVLIATGGDALGVALH